MASTGLVGWVLIVQFASLTGICLAAGWSYDEHHGDGPSHWKDHFPQCGGSKQSPINIQRTNVVQKSDMGQINFTGYGAPGSDVTYELVNNGHTVQLNMKTGVAEIKDGGLVGTYRFAQLHMHWGRDNSKGSEHTVDGKSYPLEIHFVHYNTRYGNISNALQYDDGLAVVGVFAVVDSDSHAQDSNRNEALQKLIDKFSLVKHANSQSRSVEKFPLQDLLPSSRNEFVRYSGSLTTPACLQIVNWTVFTAPITISPIQLSAFRTLNHNSLGEHDVPLVDNYRPVLPLNGRVVYSTFQPTPTVKPTSAAVTALGGWSTVTVGLLLAAVVGSAVAGRADL